MARKNKTPEDLGIDLSDGQPQQLYRWFLACLLFSRPIQQGIAADAYQLLISKGFTSPHKFSEVAREPLRKLLDDASYARYDYVASDQLHETMARVVEDYGTVSHMVKSSETPAELKKRLLAFKGVGEKTAGIFMHPLPPQVFGTQEK